MSDDSLGHFGATGRSHWIRLRTLIVLRWIAIAGQISALIVAQRVYGLQLELGLCLLAIGTSVLANLVAMLVLPRNKRLSDTEALLTLLFDTTQLAFLIFLCGGLNNPFALLIITPVTIAATALRLKSVLVLVAVTIGLISLVSFYFIPLHTADGQVLEIPQLFAFGFWVALMSGIAFIALNARRVSVEIHAMSDALLATRMALAREQKLTDLGGVIAAAAHELGTPLATIKLASAELQDDLRGIGNMPEQLLEDVQLIQEQAERCRFILRSMGRAGKDDTHLRQALLGALIDEAAEPHQGRGKAVNIFVAPTSGQEDRQPLMYRRPEIIHGLRNLIQNAVDFARNAIWVEARWSETSVTIRVADDGPGFPSHILSRIGDPFVRLRRTQNKNPQRPDYEGMGLGLFIAKTLLERSGGELTFANGSNTGAPQTRRGAVVEVNWPLDVVAIPADKQSEPLAPNLAFET